VEAALGRLGFVVAARQRCERERTGIIRLDASEEQLLARLSQGTRSHLRRARRWGATVRSAQSHEEVALFIGRYSQMSQERDLPADSPTVLQTKHEKLIQSDQLGTLLLAFLDGRFVGGLMVVQGSTIAYAHRYVVVPELLRNLRIGSLLWWEALQWAKRQGSAFFDVSGYREDADASSALYEAYRFKAGFRPTVIDKLSNYRYVCHPTLRQASRARNLLERGLRSARRAARQLRGAFDGESGQREKSRIVVGEE
jgi:lipid II:glycine glycyltransferase (peptidoglycan interpeptide bridge formation enzyme)